MRLFGSSKKKTADAPKDGIIQMRATLEMLEKKEKHLDSKISSETDTARSNATANKSLALMALKRRKIYETQREHVRGARFNLETQILTIENAHINLETLQAMKAGSSAMKSIHGALDADKVDELMDEVKEQMDLANEISSSISNPLGLDAMVDDDELEAELERFEQEQLDATLLNVKPIAAPAPVATRPSAVPAAAQKSASASALSSPAAQPQDEDAELEELRASMAL
jgi:charged multivesicular body protein 4